MTNANRLFVALFGLALTASDVRASFVTGHEQIDFQQLLEPDREQRLLSPPQSRVVPDSGQKDYRSWPQRKQLAMDNDPEIYHQDGRHSVIARFCGVYLCIGLVIIVVTLWPTYGSKRRRHR